MSEHAASRQGSTRPSAWVLEDNCSVRSAICRLTVRAGFSPQSFASLSDFEQALEHDVPDVLIADVNLGTGTSLPTLERFIATCRHATVIVMSGDAVLLPTQLATRAAKLTKPFRAEDLKELLAGSPRAASA